MKDEDFDNLGKRLYDLEAAPPKDGWEKLRPVVATAPAGKSGWINRNAWKSLFVVVPVLFYSVYHISSLEGSTPAAAISVIDTSKKEDLSQAMKKEKAKDSQPSRTNEKSQENTVSTRSNSSSETFRSKNVDRSGVGHQVKWDEAQVSEETNFQLSDNDSVGKNFSNGSAEASGIILESETSEPNKKTMSSSFVQRGGNITVADSAALIVEKVFSQERGEEVEPISQEQTGEKEEELVLGWRISAAFAPAFQTNSGKPIVNDEVYVTDVDNSTPFKQIGYGFSLGVGGSLSSNFYLDAQLSYSKIRQDIYYAFATGKVDTLLAIQQPDNSILVKPVYEIMDREIRSTHHYGGLRVMATYYFWSKPKSRFNLSTAVGVHYLVANVLEENQTGQWNEIPSDPAERMNYSFMVGAGYSVNVGQGWEFMINPTLSYFLSEVKVKGVPYSLNQQSFGINLMVSKTLFKKE